MATTKRAHSVIAKQEREAQIIAAAEGLLMVKGYFDLNMDQVARASGLAKGTVYLYFKTKEEVFLRVFERQSVLWRDDFEQRLANITVTQAALVDLLVETIATRPLFTRLVALSPVIFEYNVQPEQLRANKLWVYDNLNQIGARLDETFGLGPAQGAYLLLRVFVVVAGLEGFAHPSPAAKEVYESEPSLPRLDFATELRSLITMLLQTDQ